MKKSPLERGFFVKNQSFLSMIKMPSLICLGESELSNKILVLSISYFCEIVRKVSPDFT